MSEETIEVHAIPKAQRHMEIFKKFDELKAGDSMMIVNDHDPVPLLIEFVRTRAGQFVHEYVEQGPKYWSVRITRKGEGCCGFCGT